ncbi:MAG: putative polysaccharide biosynthesis protein [Christensenellales bacterium]
MSKKTFVRGAAILGIVGLIVKVIGAFYRIPLTAIIGEEGMGIYQIAYPIYTYLLVISTSGLPTAISKMVSEKVTLGDYRGARRVFKVSFRLLLVLGAVSTAVLWFGSDLIAGWLGDHLAATAIRYIAPALFFVSAMSAYRGYFQGMQSMAPTAVSQLVEQVGKLAIGLYLANAWFNMYLPQGQGMAAAMGAAGAMMGVSLSELAALVMLMGVHRGKKNQLRPYIKASPKLSQESFGRVGKNLAKIAIPVTVGASITPLMGMIDAAIINNTLQAVGYALSESRAMYGVLTGVVNTLVNMPAVFTVALAMSLVPAIAESKARRDMRQLRSRAGTGLKIAMLIGLPCAVGLGIFAQPIIHLLYPSLSEANTLLSIRLLELMSLAVFFISLLQAMTGVLQGMGKVNVPVFNLLIGAVIKIVISLVFIRVESINIYGAALGSIACYATTGILNVVCMVRLGGIRFKALDYIVKPVISTAVMGAVSYLAYRVLEGAAGANMALAVAIVVAVVVYAVLIVLTKALSKDDWAYLPGGYRIQKLLGKIGIMK